MWSVRTVEFSAPSGSQFTSLFGILGRSGWITLAGNYARLIKSLVVHCTYRRWSYSYYPYSRHHLQGGIHPFEPGVS